jgi:hypothetical protein
MFLDRRSESMECFLLVPPLQMSLTRQIKGSGLGVQIVVSLTRHKKLKESKSVNAVLPNDKPRPSKV